MRIKKEFKLLRLVLIAALALSYGVYRQIYAARPVEKQAADIVFVQRAVDGDTLKLSDGRRARLIGVDTPEMHYSEKLARDSRRTRKDIDTIKSMGRQAGEFTKKLCEGKKIKIYTDIQKHDKYGRLLIYAYLEDGTFINAKILSEGYGQVMTIPPDVKYSDHFLELEREARRAHKGLWAFTDNM